MGPLPAMMVFLVRTVPPLFQMPRLATLSSWRNVGGRLALAASITLAFLVAVRVMPGGDSNPLAPDVEMVLLEYAGGQRGFVDPRFANAEHILMIRDMRGQLQASIARSDDQQLKASAERFMGDISQLEAQLYQVRNQSPKDKIAFPIRLNDRLTGLRSRLERGDAAPTPAYRGVFEELSAELDGYMRALQDLISEDLDRLNAELTKAGLPSVVVRDLLIAE